MRPFLALEAARSHRELAAVIGQVIRALSPEGAPREGLVVEAERLLAIVDGLGMHAMLQPEWMTRGMCLDVLERHLDSIR